MLVIVNYGLGNLASIRNMFKRIGVHSEISGDPQVIAGAQRLVLPGVGAFDNGMQNINNAGLVPVLNKKALEDKVPILGICLGMQLLGKGSEEGQLPGLGWVDGRCRRFDPGAAGHTLKVPHMGWNEVKALRSSPLLEGFSAEDLVFYFVHSYHLVCSLSSDVLGVTNYGCDFTSVVHHGKVYGTQFHPEKSHKHGMRLLKNFVELC